MTTPYLAITDGVTTCVFLNGNVPQTYFIASGEWTPAVAGRRRNLLGGVGPWEDVEEEINCIIRGASPSDVYASAEALYRLLDQAERMVAGEITDPEHDAVTTNPVVIQWAPLGSAVASDTAPLSALVLGRADNDGAALNLTPQWDSVGYTYQIPVRIRLRRRGQWLQHTEDVGENNAGGTNVTFAAEIDYPSPSRIVIDGDRHNDVWRAGLVAWSGNNNQIRVLNAGSASTVAGSPTAATNAQLSSLATTANVMRWQAQAVDLFENALGNLIGGDTRRNVTVHVWAKVANRSVTASFWLQTAMFSQSNEYIYSNGAKGTAWAAHIPPGSTDPQIVYVGAIRAAHIAPGLVWSVVSDITNTGHYLDIDSFLLYYSWPGDLGGVVQISETTSDGALTVDPRALTAVTPRVHADKPGADIYVAYTGRAEPYTRTKHMDVVYYATSGTFWNLADGTGTSKFVPDVNVYRTSGHLLPR